MHCKMCIGYKSFYRYGVRILGLSNRKSKSKKVVDFQRSLHSKKVELAVLQKILSFQKDFLT